MFGPLSLRDATRSSAAGRCVRHAAERGEGLAGIVVAIGVVALAATTMLLAARSLNPSLTAGADQAVMADVLAVVRDETVSSLAYDDAAAAQGQGASSQSFTVAVPAASGTALPVQVVATPAGASVTFSATYGASALSVAAIRFARAAAAPGNLYGP